MLFYTILCVLSNLYCDMSYILCIIIITFYYCMCNSIMQLLWNKVLCMYSCIIVNRLPSVNSLIIHSENVFVYIQPYSLVKPPLLTAFNSIPDTIEYQRDDLFASTFIAFLDDYCVQHLFSWCCYCLGLPSSFFLEWRTCRWLAGRLHACAASS